MKVVYKIEVELEYSKDPGIPEKYNGEALTGPTVAHMIKDLFYDHTDRYESQISVNVNLVGVRLDTDQSPVV